LQYHNALAKSLFFCYNLYKGSSFLITGGTYGGKATMAKLFERKKQNLQ